MKQFNATQINILQILGDGHCHSGNELGLALGISRSAVWKQINQLLQSGIVINRISQLGYQLPKPMTLLNDIKIKQSVINKGFRKLLNLHLFTCLDSTNRYLKELLPNNAVDICCAEQQTQGRGRFGRHWHSPFGENIYCSSRWNLHCDLNKLSGLSLITSLAILATLTDLNLSSEIQVKWPNDIFWRDKKLCGSLIEILAESNGQAQVIIGIGLNVNTDTLNQPLPDKPWCSLYEISGQVFDRNKLIGSLMANLEHYLAKFIMDGFESFIDEWNKADYLLGKKIKVINSLNSISGIAKGVNKGGQLILEDDSGHTHYLSSGDTTLCSSLNRAGH